MSLYNKNKESILRYQKNSENYKKYKSEYDKKYRINNRHYANFRSTKSRLFKKYGKEIGSIRLASYVLNKKSQGVDLSLYLSPTNRD